MPKLSVKELAKSREVSDKYIYRMIQEGVIPKTAISKKGNVILIDKDRADRAMEKNTTSIVKDGGRLPPVPESVQIETVRKVGTEGLSLTEARTLTQRYRAALLKLEIDEKTGRLVDSEQVKIVAFNRARAVRDSLLNIPDRIGPIVAAETDQSKVAELLTAEIRTALEELSR